MYYISFMATVTAARQLTAEEYSRLDEVSGFRDELIEGERVLSPMPKTAHLLVLDQLTDILGPQLIKFSPTERLRIMREGGWHFRVEPSGAESIPGPDLMIVRDEDARQAARNDGWYRGIPFLVVEVISPSERKSRRLQKIGLYLEMGVPHVVEVDYQRRIISVHTPEGESATVYRRGDQITTPFRASVDEIFAILD